MAFAGFNVTFGYVRVNKAGQIMVPIYGPSASSNNITAPATSTAFPSTSPPAGSGWEPVASLYAAADSWVTVGPNPPDPGSDAPAGGRRLIQATTPTDILCSVGDKIRVASA